MGRMIALSFLFLLACEPISADQPVERPAVADCAPGLAAFRKTGGTGNAGDAQRAVRAITERSDCFENERVPVPQLRVVVETSARQTVRDLIAERDGTSAGTTEGQEACERHTALVSNPKLGIGTDGLRDLADVLCAYADAASGTQSGFLSALTQIEGVRDEKLRLATRKDLVEDAYFRRYFLGGPVDDLSILRETYPLSSVTDATAFALERLLPRLYQSPIPTLFFEEQDRDDRLRRDIVHRHLSVPAGHEEWTAVASMSDAYVKAGYDPALVYRIAFDIVMAGNEDFVTARTLASHLGPEEVRAAEDGRIRQLDAEGRYTIAVGPDGRRNKLYQMWEEKE